MSGGLFSVSAVELWGWSLKKACWLAEFYILVMLILGFIGSFASIKIISLHLTVSSVCWRSKNAKKEKM